MKTRTAKPPTSGRYIQIGRLYVPIDGPPILPDIYKIGPERRAARRAEYQSTGYRRLAKRTSNFAKIWAILVAKEVK